MDLFFQGRQRTPGSIFFKGDPFACRVLGPAAPAAERGRRRGLQGNGNKNLLKMLKSFTPFRVTDMIFVQSVYIREPKTASQWSCIASLAMGCKKNIAGGRVTKYAADGLQN